MKTVKGNVIVISMDMQLPRPKDDRWLIQGTRGLYSQERNSVFMASKGPGWQKLDKYMKEYDHTWWKTMPEAGMRSQHPGIDYLEIRELLKAIREKKENAARRLRFGHHEFDRAPLGRVHCEGQRSGTGSGFHAREVEDAKTGPSVCRG